MPAVKPARRSERDERGAVTTIVAVVLGTAVLLGMSALVVDVGQIYVEREELQSGADAAATAVAKACVTDARNCDTAAETDAIAEDYADRNAKDDRSAAAVCGRGWVGLPACGAEPTNLTRCVGTGRPPAPAAFVEVRVTTVLPDGSTVLPPSFARSFARERDSPGNTIAACARVGLTPGGPPRAMVAPAVTVEVCYHAVHTNRGTSYPATEMSLYLKNGTNGHPCNGTAGNGMNGPGNFGWLDHDGDCVATFDLDGGMYGGNTGNNTDAACQDLLDRYIDDREPMPLPLFDDVRGQGSKFEYHLTGFGAFMITGYKLSGASRASRLTGQHRCSGAERCLYGYFVRASFPVLRGDGDGDYGVTGLSGVKVIG